MSVKKIGKAVLKSYFSDIIYELGRAHDEFLLGIYWPDIKNKLESIKDPLSPPSPTSTPFSFFPWIIDVIVDKSWKQRHSDDLLKEHELRSKEYEAKLKSCEKERKELYNTLVLAIQNEVYSKPIELFYRGDRNKEKYSNCFITTVPL